MKPFQLLLFPAADELAAAAAAAWLDEVVAARRLAKPHCVALSGGRIAHRFFAAVVALAGQRAISFAGVQFFFADERCVPPSDPDSNFKLANDFLFLPLSIPAAQIHRLRGELPSAAAVDLAAADCRQVMPVNEEQLPVFDVVFLGMGEDGHVASLFPGAPPESTERPVPFLAVENSPKPPPHRISLSFAALAVSRQVWVLAAGPGKESILRTSLSAAGITPLARVVRSRQHTKIFSEKEKNNL